MISGGCHWGGFECAVISDWAQRATWRLLLAAAFHRSSPPCAAFGLWSCLEEKSIISQMEGCRGWRVGWTCKHQHGSQTDEMVRAAFHKGNNSRRVQPASFVSCTCVHQQIPAYKHVCAPSLVLLCRCVALSELGNKPWWYDLHPDVQVTVQCLRCSKCGCVPVSVHGS